jgi:hypothetical protein
MAREPGASLVKKLPIRRAPDAVVTDFHTALGQDVLQKTADEVFGAERDMTHLPAAVVAITKADPTVVEGFQPVVGDRDTEDVAAEIVENFFTTAGMLGVNDPFVLPD